MAEIGAVTSVAARYLRQQENLGSVAPGRYADLLIIDADPISDVRELRKLKTVYRGGVAYDPKGLLAQVPQRNIKDAT
jgi:imidazolonepropionase-like amidohydrolase